MTEVFLEAECPLYERWNFKGSGPKKKAKKSRLSGRESEIWSESTLWGGQILRVLLKSDLLGDCGRHGDIELRFPLHLYTKNKPCLSHSVSS